MAEDATLGERIAGLREERGAMSQRRLAGRLGSRGWQAQISRWETGRVIPDDKSIDRLAEALELGPREVRELKEMARRERAGRGAARAEAEGAGTGARGAPGQSTTGRSPGGGRRRERQRGEESDLRAGATPEGTDVVGRLRKDLSVLAAADGSLVLVLGRSLREPTIAEAVEYGMRLAAADETRSEQG